MEVSAHFTSELNSCIVGTSLIAPDYEPFRSGTASGVLGGATVPPLKGFFYGNLQQDRYDSG
jgi:hypothetical protein